jgi:hypothetical protein
LVIHPTSVIGEIAALSFDYSSAGSATFLQTLNLLEYFFLLAVAQLMQAWLEPLRQLRLRRASPCLTQGPEVLAPMIKIQQTLRVG